MKNERNKAENIEPVPIFRNGFYPFVKSYRVISDQHDF